jgi:hypothetical protein
MNAMAVFQEVKLKYVQDTKIQKKQSKNTTDTIKLNNLPTVM